MFSITAGTCAERAVTTALRQRWNTSALPSLMENDQLLHENWYFILDSKTMTWKLKYAGSPPATSIMLNVICTAVTLCCFSDKRDQTGDCFSVTDKTWVRVRKPVLPSSEVSLQKGTQAARGRQWFPSRWWNWTPRQLCRQEKSPLKHHTLNKALALLTNRAYIFLALFPPRWNKTNNIKWLTFWHASNKHQG